MKKSLLFIYFILPVYLFATPPEWFINSSIIHKNYEIIGYGSGDSKKEAKQNAKADIANSLQSHIKSSFSISKTTSKSSYSKNVNKEIKESTDMKLDSIELVKSRYIDGKYYIALRYINLPFAKKIRLKFDTIKHIKKETNSYLKHTLLLQELKDEFGFYPKIKIERDILSIEDVSFKLTQMTLKKLFSSYQSKMLNLTIPKKLKDRQYYFIDIDSKLDGYLTLIQIYQNGEVSLLFSSKKIDKDTKLQYPDKKEFDGLQAYLTDNQTKAKDLSMAILCKEKKDFEYFDNISTKKDKYTKAYGKLFDMINGCSVSSKIVEIRK